MDIQGSIKLLFETQTFASGFQKREFVVTTQEQYPQDVKFECIQDKVSLLDGLTPGEKVTVHFNLRGNEYQGKYYVNLQAWKIDKAMAAQTAPAGAMPPSAPMPTEAPATDTGDSFEEDDLPF